MRDYGELSKRLRHCPAGNPSICQLNYELEEGGFCQGCEIKFEAADAIEELIAAVRSVVHCKDCKWCHAGYCEKYDDLIPWGCANKPWEDWFCADGKRREIIKEAQDAD